MKKVNLFSALLQVIVLQGIFAQTPVVIDLYSTRQTITALGSHDPNSQMNAIIDDLGVSSERVYIELGFKTSATGAYNFDAACTGPSKSEILAMKSKGITRFIGTCFSPPAFMKMNGLDADSTCYHDWSFTKPCTDKRNKLRPDMYEAFADYLVEYIKRFKSEIGIDLLALSLQNEPEFNEAYASCVYTAGEMKKLLKLVGPKLKATGLTTKIICAETMGSYPTNQPWMDSIVADPETRQYLAAWAVHGYTDGVAADMGSAGGWTSMSNYVKKYDLPLWMTETSGYLTGWDEGMKIGQAIHLGLRFGNVSLWSYCYANNPSQPQFSLMQNSTPMPSYYASKHYYKYIKPGAEQVESSCTDKDVLVTAFRHGADKRLTLVIINNNVSSSKTILIQGDKLPTTFTMYTTNSGENFANKGSKTTSTFTIGPKSMNTLVYDGTNKQPTLDKQDTLVFLMKKPGVAANYSIDLTGISDGGGEGQSLTMTESHTNTGYFSSFSLSYTSPNTTGKINFSPVDNQTGTSTVSLTLSDGSTANNGFLSTEKTNTVIKLIPFVNHAPTVDTIITWKVQKANANRSVYLKGISDGDDGSQKLSFTVTSSNNNIISNTYIKNYTGGSTAEINMRPWETGTAYITLTIRDNGGTDLKGKDTKVMYIKVEVLEYYDIENTDISVSLYPNPTHGQLMVKCSGIQFENAIITNINSSAVISQRIFATEELIDVSALAPGVYFLKLSNAERQVVRKFVVE